MNSRVEHKGYWWIPELPEAKVSGTLMVTPGKRAELELQGHLREDHFQDDEVITNIPLILGLSINGEHFTLYDCMPTAIVSHFPGIPTSAFSINKTFVGVHFATVDGIRFKSISARYANLEEWINFHSFDIKDDVEKDEILIKSNLPKPITTKLGDYELVIRIDKRINDWWDKVNIILEARIELSSQQEKPLEDYLDRLLLIQHFLSLAISESTYPLEMQGTSEAVKQIVGDGYFYEPVDIYYGVPHLPSEELKVIPHEMLFTLPQIKDQVGNYINSWLKMPRF